MLFVFTGVKNIQYFSVTSDLNYAQLRSLVFVIAFFHFCPGLGVAPKTV